MSKQHCRILQVERFFDSLELELEGWWAGKQCFKCPCRSKSKQTHHVQFVSTLLKGQNFTINWFDIVGIFGNKVKCCFDKVERGFDIVAGVDGALHERLNVETTLSMGRQYKNVGPYVTLHIARTKLNWTGVIPHVYRPFFIFTDIGESEENRIWTSIFHFHHKMEKVKHGLTSTKITE